MRIQTTFRWLMLVALAGLSTSCWDDFEELGYTTANLKSFSFEEQDTCDGIEDVLFYIDQINGLVYNLDSLPYGSKVDYLVPTLDFFSTNGLIRVNDTVLGENQDTLDFSSPLKLTNTSEDGQYTRSYMIHVNVHQVDPDSMVTTRYPETYPTLSAQSKVVPLENGVYRAFFATASGLAVYESTSDFAGWSPLPVSGLNTPVNLSSLTNMGTNWFVVGTDGSLHTSGDGLVWTTQSSALSFVTLYGTLNRKYVTDPNPQYLIGLVKDDTGAYFGVRSPDGLVWEKGKALDADFPVREAAHIRGATVTKVQFMTVMSGFRADGNASTSVWSSENGLQWFLVRQQASLPVVGLKGNNLVYYGGNLISLGGIASTGSYVTTAYLSKDHGKQWIAVPEKWVFPDLEAGLAYGTLLVEQVEDTVNDKDRLFFWYFGGETAGQINGKVWKACEYHMLFQRR